MQIEYSIEVLKCNYTIKCIPVNTRRQSIDNIDIKMFPETSYQWGIDGFKNTQIWGANNVAHSTFRFQIEGDAITGLSDYEEDEDTDLAMIFAHPHGLNVAGDTIRQFYNENISNISNCTIDRVIETMNILFHGYKYQSGATSVDTTAEQAFSQGCGVCQDYAHIMISLLHLSGIAARYVTGFIIGEGKSHAWVEYLYNGKWYGVDPTHNRPVGDDYIKLAHGRDAKDCMINRGIMHGGGTHTQSVSVNVQEM